MTSRERYREILQEELEKSEDRTEGGNPQSRGVGTDYVSTKEESQQTA